MTFILGIYRLFEGEVIQFNLYTREIYGINSCKLICNLKNPSRCHCLKKNRIFMLHKFKKAERCVLNYTLQ